MFEKFYHSSARSEPAMEQLHRLKVNCEAKAFINAGFKKELRSNVDDWKFRYATFLNEEFIDNPNPLSKNHIFQGDGRDFDPESERVSNIV